MSQQDMGLLQLLAELDRREEERQVIIAEAQRELAEIQIARNIYRGIAEDAGIKSATLPSGHATTENRPKSGNLTYMDMSNPEATLDFLRTSGKPQKTAQIAKALKKGGIESVAKDYSATIFGTLRRLRADGRVVKVGKGLWGLPENLTPEGTDTHTHQRGHG